jgi:hypothetical protein
MSGGKASRIITLCIKWKFSSQFHVLTLYSREKGPKRVYGSRSRFGRRDEDKFLPNMVSNPGRPAHSQYFTGSIIPP